MDMATQDAPSVWRYAMAGRAHVVIDAADYFELMQEAMLGAHQRIMLVGWDFDTRVRMSGGRRWWNRHRSTRYPARFGAFIAWLARRRQDRTGVRAGSPSRDPAREPRRMANRDMGEPWHSTSHTMA